MPERIRRPPMQGWSWIDRRFVRHHAPSLTRDAILLYFFLAAVSDKNGVSYWGDSRVSALLGLSERALAQARYDLEHYDLISYDAPIYQVLSLPPPLHTLSKGGGPIRLGDLFNKYTGPRPGGDSDAGPTSSEGQP